MPPSSAKPPAKKSADKTTKKGLAASLQRLPQWLNQWGQSQQQSAFSPVLNYEPETLQLYVPEGSAPNALELEGLKYLFEQLPALTQVHFTGPGDPLILTDLPAMLHWLKRTHEIEATVQTTGRYLEARKDELLASPLESLEIYIRAHKPSTYRLATGRAAEEFILVRENVRRLVTRRIHRPPVNPNLRFTLLFDLTLSTLKHFEDMVVLAEELGVDAVAFENNPIFGLAPDKQHYKLADSLLASNPEVQTFFAQLNPEQFRLPITLPRLLDDLQTEATPIDPSQPEPPRYCQSPYAVVSVDVDYRVSACERWAINSPPPANAWDGDFWNHPQYQWLRQVHYRAITGNALISNLALQNGQVALPVPLACQSCALNRASHKPLKVLNAGLIP